MPRFYSFVTFTRGQVAKNNPSLQEEFKKIARIKNIGPSIGKIQTYLEENLTRGCRIVFSTPDALAILN